MGIEGSLHHDQPRLRQGLQEDLTIPPCQHAVVEDDGDAAILLRADETTDALPEFEHGFRHGVLHKGIAVTFADLFKPRFD